MPALLNEPFTVELPATLNVPLLFVAVVPSVPPAILTNPLFVRVVIPVKLFPPTASVAPLAFVNESLPSMDRLP